MGDTMPTVVAKGLIGLRLDRQYASPEQRAASLMYFRRAWNAASGSAAAADGVTVAAQTGSLSSPEQGLLSKQWFGPPFTGTTPPAPWSGSDFNWWHRIAYPPPNAAGGTTPFTTVSQAEATAGQEVLTLGLMRALEISFGLEPGDPVPVTTASPAAGEFDAKLIGETPKTKKKEVVRGSGNEVVLDLSACRRNLPVDVYWVCGKLDAFEVEIAWNQQQVTVFILTPPIRFAAWLALPDSVALSNKGGPGARTKKAMQSDARGMLWVGNSGTAANPNYKEWLLALSDGGVTTR